MVSVLFQDLVKFLGQTVLFCIVGGYQGEGLWLCIGATNRTRQEIQFLPYAGFFQGGYKRAKGTHW